MISVQMVALSMASAALADTTATSTTTASEVTGGLKQKIGLSYYGWFKGPAVNNITSSNPNLEGEQEKDTLLLDSIVSARYKVTDTFTVGPDIRFYLRPTREQDALLKDPWFTFKQAKIIDSNGWNLAIDARIYAPVSSGSQTVGMLTGIRTTQTLSYEIPNTRLTLGTYSYVRANFYAPNDANQDPIANNRPDAWYFYVAPNATYQLLPTLQATLWWDFVQAHNIYRSNGIINNDHEGQLNDQDIQPGINWDITPNVSFNPFLNIWPSNPTLSSTSLQFILTAKLL
jgi:hypothetical protein